MEVIPLSFLHHSLSGFIIHFIYQDAQAEAVDNYILLQKSAPLQEHPEKEFRNSQYIIPVSRLSSFAHSARNTL